MKRLPFILTVAAVAALSASLAYWGLQLFKPQQRPIAAAPVAPAPEPSLDAAKGLFGGQIAVAVASNYQLKGVVAAGVGRDSAAILAVDNKPAVALAVGREVAPGVTVKEVHPKFVLLSEGGVVKRIDLASDTGPQNNPNLAPPSITPPPMPQPAVQPTVQAPPVVMPQPQVQQSPPPAHQGVAPTAPGPGVDRQR
ncbi:MAG TPA: type II secretion system protein N [Burkholderiaceae bacterium]|nr:type II secretion system protein N [Burkholderiaceae bacterium]